jgi:hypothetical protein
VSASKVQSAIATDWQLRFTCDAASTLSVADSGIDDPVNDTGCGPQCGDLQFSDGFARLVQMICEGNGEFS